MKNTHLNLDNALEQFLFVQHKPETTQAERTHKQLLFTALSGMLASADQKIAQVFFARIGREIIRLQNLEARTSNLKDFV